MQESPAQSVAENATSPMVRRPARFAWLALASVALGGCATTSQLAGFEQAHAGASVRTLVLETPMAVGRSRLRAVLAPGSAAKSAAAEESIASGERHAQAYALTAMESALSGQPGFSVVAPGTGDEKLLDEIRGEKLTDHITQNEADRLHAATGADALLRFGITDYGLTPTSWRDGYVTFEITSTLAIAAVIAYTGSVAAHAAAGAYVAQEAVEETAEGYAGFWALDVVYRPVRLQAELIRLQPVRTVWETADTGLSDGRWSRLSGKVSQAERKRQLDQATMSAANDVVAALPEALRCRCR